MNNIIVLVYLPKPYLQLVTDKIIAQENTDTMTKIIVNITKYIFEGVKQKKSFTNANDDASW